MASKSPRDCDTPGSVTHAQLAQLPAAFQVRGIEEPRQADYIAGVLSTYRPRWREGAPVERLSCRAAGLVLRALYFGGIAPRRDGQPEVRREQA